MSEDIEVAVSSLVADIESTIAALSHYRRRCAILRVEPDIRYVRMHERLQFALNAYNETPE